jgi:hypothetical protein
MTPHTDKQKRRTAVSLVVFSHKLPDFKRAKTLAQLPAHHPSTGK